MRSWPNRHRKDYLYRRCNDQTVKDLVRLNGYGGSYDSVVQALQARYDRHKLVYKHHVKQVLSLSPIADDYHSYINFKNIATKNINGLQASKGDSFEQLLTSLFEVLLSLNASVIWSEFTVKDSRPPTLKTFLNFIDKRIVNTETLSNTTQHSTLTVVTSNHSSSKPKPKEKMCPTTFHMKEKLHTEVCPACNGAHSIYQCTVFGAWNVSCRHEFVRHKHLCFNCLGSNHSIEACNSRRTCRECKRKHYTLLHHSATISRPSDSTDIQQSAVSQSAVSQSAGVTSASSLHAQTDTGGSDLSSVQFPVTTLATVSSGCLSRRAHILVDSGSSITLVTARLANSINAPKIKSCKRIRSMPNSTVARSSHAVRLTLEPLSGSSNESVIVLAHVVDWITNIEPQDLSSLCNQPFLHSKHLADPEWVGMVW